MRVLTTTHRIMLSLLAGGGMLEEDSVGTTFLRGPHSIIVARVKPATLQALLEAGVITREQRGSGSFFYLLSAAGRAELAHQNQKHHITEASLHPSRADSPRRSCAPAWDVPEGEAR